MSFNNAKSSYFIKFLFLYLSERRKLSFVKYSKSMQTSLNIHLWDYKLLSGKYVEYGSKGKAKEYDSYDDHLVYEDEYLNGKRNGKGKEYNEVGIILYEGEYINGKRCGNGK